MLNIWYYTSMESVRSVFSWLTIKSYVTFKMPHQPNVWLAYSFKNFKKFAISCVHYWNLEQPPVASEGHNQIFLQKSMNLSEKQLIWTNYYDKWHFKWRFSMLGCITKFWLLPQKWVHFKYDESCWSLCNLVQSIRPHRSLYSHIRSKDVLILPQKPNNLTGQSYWNTL